MPRWNIDPEQTTRTLADMVSINSINPALQADGPGEAEMAKWAIDRFKSLGLETWTVDSAPNRPNVYGRWLGSGGGKSLLLTGHTDVVQVSNMTIPPFEPRIEGNRMYGRGSFDMKAGLAACLGAIRGLKDGGFQPRGDVLLGFVTDEEFGSLGTTQLVKDLKPDAAILTEPSDLEVALAHRGFAWVTLKTKGKAAHGSLFNVGIDAIAHMGKLLNEVDRLEREVMPKREHPMLGRPSVHASLIDGGIAHSTYPDLCTVLIEHRPLPDEGPDYLMGLWQDAIRRFKAADPRFEAEVTLDLFQPGWEIVPEAPIVRALGGAFESVEGREPTYRGMFGWLDSAVIHAAGIPVVVFGPGGEGAHAAVEWADLNKTHRCANVLAETVAAWCS